MNLSENFIKLDMDCSTKEDALKELASILVSENVVKPSFIDAIIERENTYPTGLPTPLFDIAIPHTVSKHVNIPGIAVGVLKNPVEFSQMGSPEIKLKPVLLIMLAITDPKDQIELLKKLMKLVQSSSDLEKIKNSQSKNEIIDILNSFIM